MEKKYYTMIGLEVHAELKTLTKMFCQCKNDADEERPNVNICPVCMAHPGTLPVVNKKAVEHVVKVGLSVNGNIADFTEFDRKNYFYPDIPKGYQISQYKYPIVSGGELGGFKLTRIHLEEDTANSKHDRGDFSLIDYNRAGVPLMELVTETHTFESAEEAGLSASKFAKEFQLLLQYLNVSEANMEKGEMRVEANISTTDDEKKFGTKVEVKNLNSFKSAERAIKFEVERMIKLLEDGKGAEIVQETRGWDEMKNKTFSQRSKENSADYRYFPDPDIPKFKLHEVFDLKEMKKNLPELPEQKRKRYKEDYGIKDEHIEIYVNKPKLASFFEKTTNGFLKDPLFDNDKMRLFQLSSNFIVTDLLQIFEQKGYPNENNQFHYYFGGLMVAFKNTEISSNNVTNELKDSVSKILSGVNIEYWDPISEEKLWKPINYDLAVQQTKNIISKKNILQVHDEGTIKEATERIITANPKVVADYKGGKENALMSLVGQVMKETKGSANPIIVKKLLAELLK